MYTSNVELQSNDESYASGSGFPFDSYTWSLLTEEFLDKLEIRILCEYIIERTDS